MRYQKGIKRNLNQLQERRKSNQPSQKQTKSKLEKKRKRVMSEILVRMKSWKNSRWMKTLSNSRQLIERRERRHRSLWSSLLESQEWERLISPRALSRVCSPNARTSTALATTISAKNVSLNGKVSTLRLLSQRVCLPQQMSQTLHLKKTSAIG